MAAPVGAQFVWVMAERHHVTLAIATASARCLASLSRRPGGRLHPSGGCRLPHSSPPSEIPPPSAPDNLSTRVGQEEAVRANLPPNIFHTRHKGRICSAAALRRIKPWRSHSSLPSVSIVGWVQASNCVQMFFNSISSKLTTTTMAIPAHANLKARFQQFHQSGAESHSDWTVMLAAPAPSQSSFSQQGTFSCSRQRNNHAVAIALASAEANA